LSSRTAVSSVAEELFEDRGDRLRVGNVRLTFKGLTLRIRHARGDRVRGSIEGENPSRGTRQARIDARCHQGRLRDPRQTGRGGLARSELKANHTRACPPSASFRAQPLPRAPSAPQAAQQLGHARPSRRSASTVHSDSGTETRQNDGRHRPPAHGKRRIRRRSEDSPGAQIDRSVGIRAPFEPLVRARSVTNWPAAGGHWWMSPRNVPGRQELRATAFLRHWTYARVEEQVEKVGDGVGLWPAKHLADRRPIGGPSAATTRSSTPDADDCRAVQEASCGLTGSRVSRASP
jgi:hypothetical protein